MASGPMYNMGTNVQDKTIRAVPGYGEETDLGITVQHGNGTVDYGELPAGTPVGRVTNASTYRPCGKTTTNGAQVGVAVLAVNESENFFEGDTVEVIDAATGVQITSQVLTAVSKTAPLTITFAVPINVADGDLVHLDPAGPQAGAETARGYLRSDVNTFDKNIGPVGSHVDQQANAVRVGVVYAAQLVGDNARIRADLPSVIRD